MKHASRFLLVAPLLVGWALSGEYDITALAENTLVGSEDEKYGHAITRFGPAGDKTLIAIGAPRGERVYIYPGLGEATKDGKVEPADAWVFTGSDRGEAGWSLAAGDLIGEDGVPDLIVGAPSELGGSGRVYVIDGSAVDGDLEPEDTSFIVKGSSLGGYVGWSVAAGDFDRDGNDDLAIGAAGVSDGDGAVYILYGPLNEGHAVETSDLLTLSGPAGSGFFTGNQLSTGDLDGDFHDDLVVGTILGSDDADAEDHVGRMYVIYDLPEDDTDIEDIEELGIIRGSTAGEGVGFRVSAAGDLNQDGGEDLVFSAPYQDCSFARYQYNNPASPACTRAGEPRVYAVMGAKDRLIGTFTAEDIADVIFESSTERSQFGVGLSTAGSLNGDFKDDVIIGEPETNTAYVFYGSGDWGSGDPILVTDADADVILHGGDGYLSPAIAAGMDLNGDSVGDMVLTAPGQIWQSEAEDLEPRAYVVLGQE